MNCGRKAIETLCSKLHDRKCARKLTFLKPVVKSYLVARSPWLELGLPILNNAVAGGKIA
jgi:hypothetical protein